SLLLALTLCPPAARDAHGLADLARLALPADVVIVAAAPLPAPAKTAGPAGEAPEEGPLPLLFSVRPLRGAALTAFAKALLAAPSDAQLPGVSGLFAETAPGGDLFRLWVGGTPIGPSRILRVAIDERLLSGQWAGWLADPGLPAPEREGPPVLAWEQVAVAASDLALRRAALGADWVAACPRAGVLA
ncbi:hypothetical protein IIA16_02655, partial [bacterium]|nr:hypothetical protein [bacterium]